MTAFVVWRGPEVVALVAVFAAGWKARGWAGRRTRHPEQETT